MTIKDIDSSLIGNPDTLLVQSLINGQADRVVQDEWAKLFSLYNTANKANFQMKCRICYMKIYLWYKTTLRNS